MKTSFPVMEEENWISFLWVSPFVNGAGALCDQKTSKFLVSIGKNAWQDTWV
jgi:hypothetical protein